MKKLLLGILLALPLTVFSQTHEPAETGFRAGQSETVITPGALGLTHKQTVTPAWVSAGLMLMTHVGGIVLPALDLNNYWVMNGMEAAVHIPLYFVDPLKGLAYTAYTGSLLAVDRYLFTRDTAETDYWRTFSDLEVFHSAMFSTYIAYRDNRVKAAPGIYNDSWRADSLGQKLNHILAMDFFRSEVYHWRPYTFGELMAAPYKKETMSDFFVWYLPIAAVLSSVMRGIINAPNENAIWNTGTTYIGHWELPAYASVPLMAAFLLAESTLVGIAEDAHHRGFIYEEVGSSYGWKTAVLTDSLYFAGMHIPGEISMDYAAGTIAANFVRRALLTVYIDVLYDRGGLAKTVAAHTWIDFPLLFMAWMYNGGAPQDDFFDLLAMQGMSLEFGIPF